MRKGVCRGPIKRTDYWVSLQFISLSSVIELARICCLFNMFTNFYRAVKKKLKERMDDFQVLCSCNGNVCLSIYVIILLFCDTKFPVTYDDLKI
jgi:hypothetical protein